MLVSFVCSLLVCVWTAHIEQDAFGNEAMLDLYTWWERKEKKKLKQRSKVPIQNIILSERKKKKKKTVTLNFWLAVFNEP